MTTVIFWVSVACIPLTFLAMLFLAGVAIYQNLRAAYFDRKRAALAKMYSQELGVNTYD